MGNSELTIYHLFSPRSLSNDNKGAKRIQPHNNEENIKRVIKWTMDFMCFWEKKSRWKDNDR